MVLTFKSYAKATVLFAIITIVSLFFVSASGTQNPPKGPLVIGVGPVPAVTLNKTELTIDIPDQTINVEVTFRFNKTMKYFIYVLLPYTINEATPYAVYEYDRYPLIFPNGTMRNGPIIGNFSTNFINTTLGSSVVNSTLELNPDFQFHFVQPDQQDELALAVSIRVDNDLVAISDSFGASKSAIFTFFGDVTGVWSDNMSAFMFPSSQMTLNAPFIVSLRLPPSCYYSNSQPGPIEYYVRQDQRWIMFSLDFLGGQYAQTLVCNFVNPTGQAYREIVIFLTGVFSAFLVTFLVEAVKSFYAERGKTKQTLVDNAVPKPPSEPQPHSIIKKLVTESKEIETNEAKELQIELAKAQINANLLTVGAFAIFASVIALMIFYEQQYFAPFTNQPNENLIKNTYVVLAVLTGIVGLAFTVYILSQINKVRKHLDELKDSGKRRDDNGIVERLLACEKNLEDCENDLQTWTDSLEELSEIEDVFESDEKNKLHGKTILDIGTDCVKPLYIALKFEPDKIIGIDEDLPSIASDIKLKSRLLTETKIGFYDCSFFDEEGIRKICEKEETESFDFVIVSKTLHHLRTGVCIEKERDDRHEHQKDETEKCCIYRFDAQEIFDKLLKLGKRVIIYETFFPQEEDEDKVRGRGGYFTTKEWEKILIFISDKYKVEFITPIKCHLDSKELEKMVARLRQVDCICFYVEKQDVESSKIKKS